MRMVRSRQTVTVTSEPKMSRQKVMPPCRMISNIGISSVLGDGCSTTGSDGSVGSWNTERRTPTTHAISMARRHGMRDGGGPVDQAGVRCRLLVIDQPDLALRVKA